MQNPYMTNHNPFPTTEASHTSTLFADLLETDSPNMPETTKPWSRDTLCAEVFSVFDDNELRGMFLARLRTREELTQTQLGAIASIPAHRVGEYETGKRRINESDARALAQVLRVDFRLFYRG